MCLLGAGVCSIGLEIDSNGRPKLAGPIHKVLLKDVGDGAYGMSAGLEYVPGRWATTEEMLALVSELAEAADKDFGRKQEPR